jgi:hypothetical protein
MNPALQGRDGATVAQSRAVREAGKMSAQSNLKLLGSAVLALGMALPPSAIAATESVDITYPAGTNFNEFLDASSNPFSEFNPALGMLTSYSLTVAGIVTSTDPFTPEIVFKDPGTADAILDLFASGGAISGTGSTSSSFDLAAITGTGTAQFLVQDFSSPRGATTSISFTTDTLTYTYTPAVASVPEPSTWAMGLIGFGLMGLLGYRKTRGALA